MKLFNSTTIIALTVLIGTTTLHGALPPLYQTAAEIASIAQDPELGKALPDGEPIVSIRMNDHGYIVTTTKHQVLAKIVYEPATRPGPAHFKVKFQAIETLEQTGRNE